MFVIMCHAMDVGAWSLAQALSVQDPAGGTGIGQDACVPIDSFIGFKHEKTGTRGRGPGRGELRGCAQYRIQISIFAYHVLVPSRPEN